MDTENTADGEGDVRRIWEKAREHERAERAWGQGREPAPALVDSKGKKHGHGRRDAGFVGRRGPSVASGINSDLHCVRAVEVEENGPKHQHLLAMVQPARLHKGEKRLCIRRLVNKHLDPRCDVSLALIP